ncbi:MAG TPA: hypothetical protein VGB57_09295 [Allosphingosinicella sp.]|jgi:hypothetical protein
MTDRALGTKHLEMLQAAISRLAGNAFLIKGWSIALATAVAGFAVKDGASRVALVGIVPIALFWCLDSYYLSLERAFRALFDSTRAQVLADLPPTLDMTPSLAPLAVVANAFRPAVILVHLPAQILLLAAAFAGS